MAKPLVIPNGENCSMSELEVASGAAATLKSHRRLMAIRALILGISHEQAAVLF